ncbi:MAG: hypothetical protein K8U57_28605 [Planctomycetes bacterium]|nr:hypothetical protein [Planctomycetota bacterium]
MSSRFLLVVCLLGLVAEQGLACGRRARRIGCTESATISTVTYDAGKSGQWICGFTAPPGYAITQYGYQSQCGGNPMYNNACYIERPQDGMWICGFTAPPGYVITQHGYRPQCGSNSGGYNNSSYIKKLP